MLSQRSSKISTAETNAEEDRQTRLSALSSSQSALSTSSAAVQTAYDAKNASSTADSSSYGDGVGDVETADAAASTSYSERASTHTSTLSSHSTRVNERLELLDYDLNLMQVTTSGAYFNLRQTVVDRVAPWKEQYEGTDRIFTISGLAVLPGSAENTTTVAIDWGDGDVTTDIAVNTDREFTSSHYYLDDDVYTVTLTETGETEDGGSLTHTSEIYLTIYNVAPSLTSSEFTNIAFFEKHIDGPAYDLSDHDETVFNRTFTYSDSSPEDTHWVIVDWDDGTVQEYNVSGGSFNISHTFVSKGSWDVSVTLYDDDYGSATDSFRVTVLAVPRAPTLTVLAAVLNGTEDDVTALTITALELVDATETLSLYVETSHSAFLATSDPETAFLVYDSGTPTQLAPNTLGSGNAQFEVPVTVADGQTVPDSGAWDTLYVDERDNWSGDFTMTITARSTEDDDSIAETSVSVVVHFEAVADTPSVTFTAVPIVEDTESTFEFVVSSVDTDGSEELSSCLVGVPAGATLSEGALVDGEYCFDNTDLFENTITASFDPTDNSDEDVTFTFSATTLELSNEDSATTVVTRALPITAVADTPNLATEATTGVTEDISVFLTVTPTIGVDTDGSEAILKTVIRPLILTSFSGISSTSSVEAASVYTLTEVGTGFESGLSVSSLSVLGPVDCDEDFTVSVHLVSVEDNEKTQALSDTASIGVVLSANLDQPTIVAVSLSTSEDVSVLLHTTPSYGSDTDDSERLRKLAATSVPVGISFDAAGFASSSRAAGMSFTVTSSGTGFATGVGALLSASAVVQCDIDFTVSLSTFSVEENNLRQIESSTVSMATALSAVADIPHTTVTVATSTSENIAVALIVSPEIGIDTDESEFLRKLLISSTPAGASFLGSLSSTVSEIAAGFYTLSTSEATGFASEEPLEALSISSAVQCDVDFTLSASMQSVEENKRDVITSTTKSIGVALSAISDTPTFTATSATSTTEDIQVQLNTTPTLGLDTDLSDTLRKIAVTNLVSGLSFKSVDSTSSALHVGNAWYTLSSLVLDGFDSASSVSSFSTTPATQCDVDFTFSLAVRAVEHNRQDEIVSTTLSIGTAVRADADPPAVGLATTTTQMTEDTVMRLDITPSYDDDSDFSDRLFLFVLSGLREDTIFSPTSNAARNNNGTRYTVVNGFGIGTGFTPDIKIPSLSMSTSADCDIDFSMTVTVQTSESNSADYDRASRSMGIAVAAREDTPTIDVIPLTSTTEDFAALILVTPGSGGDTDGSEQVIRMRVVSPVMQGVSFTPIADTNVVSSAGTFTLTPAGTGFEPNIRFSSYSVSPSVQCDIDFTLSFAMTALEVNTQSSVTSSFITIGATVAADPDNPSFIAAAAIGASEDFAFPLSVTPLYGRDTDKSDAFKYVEMTGIPDSAMQTLTMSGSGFHPGVFAAGLSASPAAQCDVDFTMTVQLYGVEVNNLAQEATTSTSVGVELGSVGDQPRVSIFPITTSSTAEDVSVRLKLTPLPSASAPDTDGSEVIGKVKVAPASNFVFSSIGGTSSAVGDGLFTLTMDGTGFAEDQVLAGLSTTAGPDCDIDFTLSYFVATVELNNGNTKFSTSKTVGFVISASPDLPSFSAPAVQTLTEDLGGLVLITPSFGQDTDASDALRVIMIASLPTTGSFASLSQTSSEQSSGAYTVTRSGSGFASGEKVASLSASTPVQCDIDFSLTIALRSAEINNDALSTTGTASVGVEVYADADVSSVSVVNTATTEDIDVFLSLTPSAAADTDKSEAITKVRATPVPGSMKFSAPSGSTQVEGNNRYTATHSGTGFDAGVIVEALSVSPAFGCDLDFTLTFNTITTEANGGDQEFSPAATIGVSLHALSTVPEVELEPGAVYFDGTGAYVTLDAFAIGGTAGWSMQATIYPESTGADQTLFELQGNDEIRVMLTDEGQLDFFVAGSSLSSDLDTPIPFDTWTELWLSVDGSTGTVLIYVAETLEEQLAGASLPNDEIRATRYLGALDGLSGNFFKGYMKDVRFWDKYINDAIEWVQTKEPSLDTSDSDLLTYLKMDERAGPTLEDSSDNDVDGTLSGTASITSPTLTVEDRKIALLVTPGLGIDCDDSETLYKITISVPTGVSFISLANTESSISNTMYTLTSPSTGFADDIVFASYSLSPTVQCDVDFTISLVLHSVEKNGGDQEATSGKAIRVPIDAVSDTPTIAVPTGSTLAETEDYAILLSATPSSADTDLSDRFSKLAVRISDVSFSAVASTGSASSASGYTLSALGSYQLPWDALVPGLSISRAVQCDIDFSLTAQAYAIEANGQSAATSASVSLGTEVHASADTPTLAIEGTQPLAEDAALPFQVTPSWGADSDESEVLRSVWVSTAIRSSFSAQTDSSSAQTAGVYTLTSTDGFSSADAVTLTQQHAVQCDIDFTVSVALRTVESNALSVAQSAVHTMGVVLSAVVDTATLVAANTETTEDVAVHLKVTPAITADTDLSERLTELWAVHTPLTPFDFATPTSAVESSDTNIYTWAMSGTGYDSSSKVASLSVSAGDQSDIDFTLTMKIQDTEMNNELVELTVATIGVAVDADADTPTLSATAARSTLEDTRLALYSTPKQLTDTDSSDLLKKVVYTGSLSSATSLRFTQAGSSSEHSTTAYTCTNLAAAGYSSNTKMTSLSLSSAHQCDIDFTISLTVTSYEVNSGHADVSTSRSIGIAVSASNDQPTLSVASTTAATEDIRVPVRITPSYAEDTDASEILARVKVSPVSALSFTSLSLTTSTVAASSYTLLAASSGFTSGTQFDAMSVSSAVQCDTDFTLTLTLHSAEENNAAAAATATGTIGYVVSANAETPSLTRAGATLGTTEDIPVHVVITPTQSVDTDVSDRIRYIVATNLASGVSFKGVPSTTSSVSGNVYTLDGNGLTQNRFASGSKVASLSVVPPLEDSTDFTLTLRAVSYEANNGDEALSSVVTVGIAITADPNTVTTIAGSTTGDSDSTTGTSAEFDNPVDLTLDDHGSLYITDFNNHKIKVIRACHTSSMTSGTLSTGSTITVKNEASVGIDLIKVDAAQVEVTVQTSLLSGDTTGDLATFVDQVWRAYRTGTSTLIYEWKVFGTDEDYFVAECLNSAVATLSGTGDSGYVDSSRSASEFQFPSGIVYYDSYLYVADTLNHAIRKVDSRTGATTNHAGSTAAVSGNIDSTGTAARFNQPYGIAVDSSTGDLYVSDKGTHVIRKVTAAGVVTTISGTVSTSGSTDGSSPKYNTPKGLAYTSGILYISDFGNHVIRKLTLSNGAATTLAGSAGLSCSTTPVSNCDGTGTAARLKSPEMIAYNSAQGRLYLADSLNHVIRVVTSGGRVITLAGSSSATDSDGDDTAAGFNAPTGIALQESTLTYYIADAANDKIKTMT